MPPPDLELSTYHTDDLDADAIRDLAQTNVLPDIAIGRSIYGHADLPVASYAAQNLTATRDDDPERHTLIAGWPVGTADDKETHKEIALELAELALLRLFNEPLTR